MQEQGCVARRDLKGRLGFVRAAGLISSLARPGGNITGMTYITSEIAGKRLELLRQMLPRAGRIAVLYNRDDPSKAIQMRELEAAARALGMAVQVLGVRDGDRRGRRARELKRLGALLPGSLQSGIARFLFIVARRDPVAYVRLKSGFVNYPDIDVALDRRRGQRRRQTLPPEVGRRMQERRSVNIDALLQQVGWVVVEQRAEEGA
jgi:hypothetical protein